MKEVKLLIPNLRRIISIIFFSLFFIQALSSQQVILSFGTESEGTVEILIENSVDVYGFQFIVTGINIISAEAGEVVPSDWMLSASGDMVLGFSLMGSYFSAGSGILVNMNYEVTDGDICIEGGVVQVLVAMD